MIIGSSAMVYKIDHEMQTSMSSMADVLEKLSTGYKVNRGSDEAGALMISSGLSSKAKSFQAAINNAQTGLTYAQVAKTSYDSALAQLEQAKSLAIQATDPGMSAAARTVAADSMTLILEELESIKYAAEVEDISVFGTGAVAVGAADNDAISTVTLQIGVENTSTSRYAMDSFAMNLGELSLDVSTDVAATASLATINTAIESLEVGSAGAGARATVMQGLINSQENQYSSLVSSLSQIRDVDTAYETANFTVEQMKYEQNLQALNFMVQSTYNSMSNLLGFNSSSFVNPVSSMVSG